jgi:hypothetical protein
MLETLCTDCARSSTKMGGALRWGKWAYRIALALYWLGALLGYGPGSGKLSWVVDFEIWFTNRFHTPDPIMFAFVSGLILSTWLIPDVWKWARRHLPITTRAKLSVSGPHLHKDPAYKSQNHWRMTVHNNGPAAAENVRLKLTTIAPRPKYPPWQADYPYPVVRVGSTADAPAYQINPDDGDNYEIVCGWKSGSAEFFTNLDTKASRSPIRIEADERWTLSYELTAKNADPMQFTLRMFVEGDEVQVVKEA